MNKVNSIDTLDLFFEKYFLKNTQTNNYFLAETYRQLISEGKLFYHEGLSNMYLLVEKDSFFQLYFFINNLDEDITITSNKPIVMEIVYRGPNNKPNDLILFWDKNGFKQHLTRDNLSLTYGKIKQFETKNASVQLKYADTIDEANYVKNLFETSLDKYTGDLLTLDEIIALTNKKNIICAYINQTFCGALQFELKNNIIWLGHIAIDLNYRGNGIANLLVSKYIEDNKLNDNSRYQLWVIDDNSAAQSLYSKFGFVYTNKSTTSIIKL